VTNLVNQLRFTRAEFRRGFEGVPEEDGGRRILPLNSIAWMVGHLAWHEQNYWLKRAQGMVLFPELESGTASGQPPGDLSLNEMIARWEAVTTACDDYLSRLTAQDLDKPMRVAGKEQPGNVGSMIQRIIYHYWYHCGEMQAVRQLLGHASLPEFVSGEINTTGRFFMDRD
jgi:uncharacterized damage-inducible protein DinB